MTGGRIAALRPVLLASALLLGSNVTAASQPDASFRSSCGDLRASLAKLDLGDARLVVIQVLGRLTAVRFDGALAYLSVCSPPDPQVLCITYSTNDRKVGDEIVLSGAYEPRGSDRILLDPCLHFIAGAD